MRSEIRPQYIFKLVRGFLRKFSYNVTYINQNLREVFVVSNIIWTYVRLDSSVNSTIIVEFRGRILLWYELGQFIQLPQFNAMIIVVLSDEFSLKIAFDKSWAIYEMGVGMLKLKHYGLKTFNVIS